MTNQIVNPELQLAFDYVQYTGRHVFLTGKAGTGKTTFLHNLKLTSPKRMIVTAPTGVAAINAGGITLHSFFQMPFSPYIPRDYLSGMESQSIDSRGFIEGHWKLNREKINIIRSLDLLVIDEISMVRADILDQIDAILRRYKNRNKVFGGVQLLMIGDIHQLAPVAKDEEWNLLKRFYDTIFFFSSKALQKVQVVCIELKHIFRQSDSVFITILNKIRNNRLDEESRKILSQRYIPGFRPDSSEGYITLTTHNSQSKEINDLELGKIQGQVFEFAASLTGQFPEYSYPTDSVLKLKTGAQVMFVKNDGSKEKLYYNGKIGQITRIEEEQIFVKCAGNNEEILVEKQKWQNLSYTIDEETKEILEEEIGSFVQYPLKLAWAITIHKSQGLTFEKAIIDANAAFAYGQVYVALSRCKSLEGLILSTPLSTGGIISNIKVNEFSKGIEENPPKQEQLIESKKEYQQQLIEELFDFTYILQKLFSGKKILKESNLKGSDEIVKDVDIVIESYKTEIIQVSEKFNVQLKHLFLICTNYETDNRIQDRIKKACVYFHDILSKTVESSQFQLITDNKELKAHLKKFREELNKTVQEKLECLEICKNGFSIKVYTETRAKSAIAVPYHKPSSDANEDIELKNVNHPVLLERLKVWRNHKAKDLNIPHFMIMHQKTLYQMVESLPVSFLMLNSIKGFGKKKAQAFGTEILEIIRAYTKENKIETSSYDEMPAAKKEKVDTKKLSFDLYSQGKSVEEIAKERNMSVSTIEGHMAYFIRIGELSVEKFVEPSKFERIAKYFLDSNNLLLGPAKAALGDDCSFGELKMVLNHLQFHEAISKLDD